MTDKNTKAVDERESYLSLADEMNDDGMEWDPDEWDPQAIKEGKAFAKRNGLAWPPRNGDFERFCDLERNGEAHYA